MVKLGPGVGTFFLGAAWRAIGDIFLAVLLAYRDALANAEDRQTRFFEIVIRSDLSAFNRFACTSLKFPAPTAVGLSIPE